MRKISGALLSLALFLSGVGCGGAYAAAAAAADVRNPVADEKNVQMKIQLAKTAEELIAVFGDNDVRSTVKGEDTYTEEDLKKATLAFEKDAQLIMQSLVDNPAVAPSKVALSIVSNADVYKLILATNNVSAKSVLLLQKALLPYQAVYDAVGERFEWLRYFQNIDIGTAVAARFDVLYKEYLQNKKDNLIQKKADQYRDQLASIQAAFKRILAQREDRFNRLAALGVTSEELDKTSDLAQIDANTALKNIDG